jgi:hypothetical protein
MSDTPRNRVIAKTPIGIYEVSTVRLSDMAPFLDGLLTVMRRLARVGTREANDLIGSQKPYETLVFTEDDGTIEKYMRRYDTEEEARKGHEETVALVRSELCN